MQRIDRLKVAVVSTALWGGILVFCPSGRTSLALAAGVSCNPHAVGSTFEPHSITRGQNRKLFTYKNRFYAIWNPELGECTGIDRLQYSITSNLATGWTQQGDTSLTEDGGASGVDFMLPNGGIPAPIVSLESSYGSSTNRNYQYLRAYTIQTDGTMSNLDATFPIAWIGSTTTGPIPPVDNRVARGYGSAIQDSDGLFWIAERDEGDGTQPDVGNTLNDIILYKTTGNAAKPLSFAATPPSPLPVCGNPGCTTIGCIPCRPFQSVVPSATNSERATRVLFYRDPATGKKWIILVAYVPDPANAPGKAACYLRAFEKTGNGNAGSWRKVLTVVKWDALYVSSAGHPDARPSSWVDGKGDVWVSYVPITGNSVRMAKISLASEYQTVVSDKLVFTAPPGDSILSASVRIDERKFNTTAVRAYVISLVNSDVPNSETDVYVHRTQDSGATWSVSPRGYCTDGGLEYQYQSGGPSLAGRGLVTLVQTNPIPGGSTCNYSSMAVSTIDLSSERFAP